MKNWTNTQKIIAIIVAILVIWCIIQMMRKKNGSQTSGYSNCTPQQAGQPCCKDGKWYGGEPCTTGLGDAGTWGNTSHGTCSCYVASSTVKPQKRFLGIF